MKSFVIFFFLLAVASAQIVADHPTASISNGVITAKLYTPDADNGYYRGTRFDWSGVVYSLTYKDHEYFGEWQKSTDPRLHDRITGPVEEYRSDGKGLGYDEAAVGGRFVRIGVGACEKPEEEDYRWTHSYKVVDPGVWTTKKGKNWIEFTQALDAGNGYAYLYTKRLTLTEGAPELLLSHRLENTGTKAIASSVYNHNFFVIDSQPTGPDFVVRFPFELTATQNRLREFAEVRGKELVYLKEIPQGTSVITLLEGFGSTVADHGFEIENRKVKAGVRMSTDKPLSKMQFWSPHTTLCPEPYVDLSIESGKSESWAIRYEFYTLD